MKKIIFPTILAVVFPVLASAQDRGIFNLVDFVIGAAETLFKFLVPFAMAAFFWNMIKMIKLSGEGAFDKLKDAKSAVFFSGVALFLMVGIWSVVAYVQHSVGITNQQEITTGPVLPGVND